MGDFKMKRGIQLLLLVVVVGVAHAAETDSSLPVSQDEMWRAIVGQLERFQAEGKPLTNEEGKSLEAAIMQIGEYVRRDPSMQTGLEKTLSDIALFRGSPAYSFLDDGERGQFQRLTAWIQDARNGKTVSPLTFIESKADGAILPSMQARVPSGLRRGDLVFRREEGFLSRCFIEASSREKRFSHVGIVCSCGDSVKVISVGDDGMSSGTVEAEEWSIFMSASVDGAVYRFKGHDDIGERIALAAERRLGIPFDPAFDLKTKDRLYCSELVHDAVNEAVGEEVIGTTKRGDFEYVALDDCYRTGWMKVFDVRETK